MSWDAKGRNRLLPGDEDGDVVVVGVWLGGGVVFLLPATEAVESLVGVHRDVQTLDNEILIQLVNDEKMNTFFRGTVWKQSIKVVSFFPSLFD